MMSCAMLLLAAVLAVQPAPPVDVPSVALAAARSEPIWFAKLLVHAGVPVGIELRQVDERLAHTRSAPAWVVSNMERTAPELRADPRVLLSHVLDVFNSSHRNYGAALVNGVVVIRPHAARMEYLDAQAPQVDASPGGLMQLVARLFAIWDPEIQEFGGGSHVGPPGTTIDRADSIAIEVDTGGRTIIEVLNDAVAHVPGQGWMVVTSGGERPQLAEMAIIHRHFASSVRRSGVAPPAPAQ